jgi:hypothetical protein
MNNHPGKPDSSQMAKQFENYLRCHIFVKKYFIILEKADDLQANQDDSIESSIHPDFKMRDKMNKSFYLETRFRPNNFEDKINWCSHGELKRYQEFDKISPVFIVIGLGGKPDNPQNLFLFSLQDVNHPDLELTTAFTFQIPLGKPVIPDDLWKLLKTEYRKAG